jgi:hypothetical protein
MSLTSTKNVERGSQATPLAEDVLRQLSGELSGGLGAGVGPAQRNSIDALGKALASMQARSGPAIDPSGFLDALSSRNAAFTDRQAADQRDIFGAGGSRFGSQVQQGESDLRRGAARDFGVTSAGALLDAEKFNVGAQQTQDQILMQGLGQLFGMGSASLNPFMQALHSWGWPSSLT